MKGTDTTLPFYTASSRAWLRKSSQGTVSTSTMYPRKWLPNGFAAFFKRMEAGLMYRKNKIPFRTINHESLLRRSKSLRSSSRVEHSTDTGATQCGTTEPESDRLVVFDVQLRRRDDT